MDEVDKALISNVLDLAQQAEADGAVPFLVRVRECSDEFGAGVDLHVYFIVSGDVVRLHTHAITNKADALAIGEKLALVTLGITGQLEPDPDEDDPTPPFTPPRPPLVA